MLKIALVPEGGTGKRAGIGRSPFRSDTGRTRPFLPPRHLRAEIGGAVAAFKVEPNRSPRFALVRNTAARFWRARRSEEHTSELQSLMRNSYAVFCLKKK